VQFSLLAPAKYLTRCCTLKTSTLLTKLCCNHAKFSSLLGNTNSNMIRYLRTHPDMATEFRPFEWTYAYEHAAATLALAVQRSNSRVDRFSSRFMDPRTPVIVTQALRRTISSIFYHRAVALELEFRQTDVMISLDQKMSQLSGLFQIVFNAAADTLRFLHIGL
jgi:hypothetical protein